MNSYDFLSQCIHPANTKQINCLQHMISVLKKEWFRMTLHLIKNAFLYSLISIFLIRIFSGNTFSILSQASLIMILFFTIPHILVILYNYLHYIKTKNIINNAISNPNLIQVSATSFQYIKTSREHISNGASSNMITSITLIPNDNSQEKLIMGKNHPHVYYDILTPNKSYQFMSISSKLLFFVNIS